MLCKVCNKEVEAGLKTCPYCGAQMEGGVAEIVSIKFTRKKAQAMPKEGEKSTTKKKRSGISKKNLQDEAPITVIEDPTLFEEEEVKDYDPDQPVILVFDEPEKVEEPVAPDENPISVEEPEEPAEVEPTMVAPEDDETVVVLGEEGNVYAKEEPVEKPAIEEPVEETPVEEPVAEEPVEEAPVEEAPVEEPVAEEPVEEAPAEEPVAEKPAEEAPAEEPVAEEPVEETPVEEPVAEEPVEEAPAEDPVAEKPAEETPVEEPVAE